MVIWKKDKKYWWWNMRLTTKKRKSKFPAANSYGSLNIGVCRYCAGETIIAKGRYKAYMFCIHCDKVYKIG